MGTKKASIVNIVLMVIIFGCAAIIGFQQIEIQKLRNNIPSLPSGQSLPSLGLVRLDNTVPDEIDISKGVTLIMIFKTPCTACNANLSTWKNLARFFGDKINILGIVRDGNRDAAELMEDKELNFSLYMPSDNEVFNKRMYIKSNHAQTIIIHDNKIKFMRARTLSPVDLKVVVAKIKKMIAAV